MTQLAFTDDEVQFDRYCIRFKGRIGREEVTCGVTTYALQYRDPDIPKEGLVPSEAFLAAFDKFALEIHQAARRKYERGEVEPDGEIKVMIHRKDLCR